MPTANAILSVTALDFRTLLVLFGNAGVPQLTVDLTPTSATYVLTPVNLPAVTPGIASITSHGETGGQMLGVTIVTDDDLSPDINYQIAATGITGIAVDSVHNVSIFLARGFDFPAERSFDLINYIPSDVRKDDTTEELADFVACLQEPLNFLINDIDRWINILDCDVAPENFVDLMLADLANPFIFANPLSLTQKRRLVGSLVAIYKLKGTVLGCQTAIQFFLGMPSEFVPMQGLGNKLNMAGGPYHGALSDVFSDPFVPPHSLFRLGSRRRWRFLVKVGTSVRSQEDAGQVSPSPAAGGPLTDTQRDQISRILAIMKPAYMIRIATGTDQETGPVPTVRSAIRRDGGGFVTLIMKLIAGATDYKFLEGESPGVNRYNAGGSEIAGTTIGSDVYTASFIPPAVFYWNGIGNNSTHGTLGLLGHEVTNALSKPVVTPTPVLRSINLTWVAIVGATAYRIYRSSSAAVIPPDADNADDPIEISSDFTTYNDFQESGTTKFYIVTPVVGDSEGFFSAEVSATAL